jgi:Domain of unknown function (DUF929)
VLGTLGLLVVLVGVILAARWTASTFIAPPPSGVSAAQLERSLTAIPASELRQVGRGSARAGIEAISAPALVGSGGKPAVLYVGAEFCPYCAAERWAIIVALSRFGTFSGLRTTRSAALDAYPSTPTFSFRSVSYSSPHLDFVALEGGQRPPDLSGEQAQLVDRYDPSGAIPFVDFGNRSVLMGATYDPGVLQGSNWGSIASALRQPSSPQAQGILGSADEISGALCALTVGQPASACSA